MTSPAVFWALRGGGAGSWGVLISATFRTYPTFNLVHHAAAIQLNSSAAVSQLVTLHAQHIFDWDDLHVGQYFYLVRRGSSFTMAIASLVPNTSISIANATLSPFFDAAVAQGFDVSLATLESADANDVLSTLTTDATGINIVLGSRLIPEDVYRCNATGIGETYKLLLDAGTPK